MNSVQGGFSYGISHHQEVGPLFIAQVNSLHKTFHGPGRGLHQRSCYPHPVPAQDYTSGPHYFKSFRVLKMTFVDSHRPEQLRLRIHQRIVTTVEDSVFRTEMGDLESQEENTPKSVLWYTGCG